MRMLSEASILVRRICPARMVTAGIKGLGFESTFELTMSYLSSDGKKKYRDFLKFQQFFEQIIITPQTNTLFSITL